MKPNGERLIIAIGLVRLALGLWLGFRPFDDTYITFRYALNLASGFGLVYNIGEPVLGTTSPLWAIVLASLHALHLPMESASLALSLSFDIVTAVLLFRLLTHLGYRQQMGVAAAVLFLCVFDYFSISRSGMETACFVFLTIGALEAMASRRFPRAAVFCTLACLTRPEGAVLVVLLSFALWRLRSTLLRREVLASLALVALIGGLWTLYALQTFGSVIPQSVVAKVAASRRPDLKRFSWINVALFFLRGQHGGEIFTRTYIQLMPVITLLSGVAAASSLRELVRHPTEAVVLRWIALLLFPLGYVTGLALSHAFTYYPWYYGPIYPFAAALAVIGANVLSRRRTRLAIGMIAILVMAQLTAAALVKLPGDHSFWVEGYNQVSAVVPRSRNVTVAALEIGVVGWRTWPATVLDVEGLVTPGAVGMADDDFVRLKGPAYVVLRTDNAADFLRRVEQSDWFSSGYELVTARRDPYADREFRVYRLKSQPPNP